MSYITVKFPGPAEKVATQFMAEAADNTPRPCAEEERLLEWSRSLDEPDTFVLL
jgi:hypothetical protein